MSESVYFLTLCLPLGTILIVFGMRYFALVQQARAQAAGNVDGNAALQTISASLADIQARLSAIEKILKAVE
ncbi:hypothetical protein [Scleromatobacter humisilvae]|uniref:Phage shock protein B n=1 Tax=Scleromatobacter humisilvae TaxID=2897159 RepID=A0A9X2C1D7_9BURK|nr:hypothetical protein [Scleromatobacter humisilvae]MCK9688187.1 hypothetical protein [Scleromatobacter humisilvae]